jgi:hypothetical protein
MKLFSQFSLSQAFGLTQGCSRAGELNPHPSKILKESQFITTRLRALSEPDNILASSRATGVMNAVMASRFESWLAGFAYFCLPKSRGGIA